VVGYKYKRKSDWKERDGVYDSDGDYKYCSDYHKVSKNQELDISKYENLSPAMLELIKRQAMEKCTRKLNIILNNREKLRTD